MTKNVKKIRKTKVVVSCVLLSIITIFIGYYFLNLKESSKLKDSKIQHGYDSEQKQALRDAPRFELAQSSGQKIRLEDFQGKFIILHFWASWCKPCLDEIPRWIELIPSFKDSPVQFIAVSLDSQWSDALQVLSLESLKKSSGQVVSLLDPSSKISDEYGSFQFPETYLLSPDLKILFKWVGPQNWNAPETRGFIEKLLNTYQPKS